MPGAVHISNLVLEHIQLENFFQIINGPGQHVHEAFGPGPISRDQKSP